MDRKITLITVFGFIIFVSQSIYGMHLPIPLQEISWGPQQRYWIYALVLSQEMEPRLRMKVAAPDKTCALISVWRSRIDHPQAIITILDEFDFSESLENRKELQ